MHFDGEGARTVGTASYANELIDPSSSKALRAVAAGKYRLLKATATRMI